MWFYSSHGGDASIRNKLKFSKRDEIILSVMRVWSGKRIIIKECRKAATTTSLCMEETSYIYFFILLRYDVTQQDTAKS